MAEPTWHKHRKWLFSKPTVCFPGPNMSESPGTSSLLSTSSLLNLMESDAVREARHSNSTAGSVSRRAAVVALLRGSSTFFFILWYFSLWTEENCLSQCFSVTGGDSIVNLFNSRDNVDRSSGSHWRSYLGIVFDGIVSLHSWKDERHHGVQGWMWPIPEPCRGSS